jgi:ornithine cyclodeaminase/alanine dehydrogenase-like protein (mu-crystallin family)
LSESGDLLIPIREGAMDEGSIAAELADLVLGSAPARRGADQITLFKSLGLAMEDAAAAAAVIERAALA